MVWLPCQWLYDRHLVGNPRSVRQNKTIRLYLIRLESGIDRFECSDSVFLGLRKSRNGGIGSSACMTEGLPNQIHASRGDPNGSKRCPKHPNRPESHALLGFQIGYFALYLPLAFYGVIRGFKFADGALDRIHRGDKAIGFGRLLGGLGFALFCAGVLPWLGYWLTFEGGFSTIGVGHLLGLSQ
jgi:hypothetical protein